MKPFFENAHQLFLEIISILSKSENSIQFNLLHLIEKYQHPIAILNSDMIFLFFNNKFSEFFDLNGEDINALDPRNNFDLNTELIDSPINKLNYSSTTLIGNINPKNTSIESSFELHRAFNSFQKDYYYIITNFESFSKYIDKDLRYELLHNSMDIGIGYYSRDGAILSYNAKAANYLGGKPEDFQGKTLHDIFPQEQATEYLNRIKQTINSNSAQHFYDEINLTHKTLWFKSTYNLVKNEKDQIIGVQIISDDITEQKNSEIITHKFFEQNQSLHLISTLDGRILKTNSAWEEKLGYTSEELVNSNFMQLVHPDDQQKTLAELKNLEDGNDTLYFENRYKHKNGNYIHLAWSANTNKSERLAFAVAFDISSEKKAQQALKENESKFTTFISKTKDGVCIVNQFGEITFVNSSFSQIINLPEDEVIGMYAWDLLFEMAAHNDRSIQRKEQIKKEVFNLLKTKNDINISVNYVRIKAGVTNEIKEVVESVFNFDTADGKNLGIFMRDVTDLKLAEIEIKTAYELLKETEKIGKSGSWTFDPITQVGSWSKGAYDIRKLPYDLNPDAALHEKYMHQKDVIRYREIFSRNLESSKNKFSQYYRLIDSEGNLKHIEANYEIQRNSDGIAIFVTGIDRDITEIIIAHEELQKTKDEYKTLSDASFESIFISEKGICIGQNKKAEEMFGYSLEEALGKPGIDWIAEEERQMVMDKMIKNDTNPYSAIALRKDGSTFPCEIQARVLNKNGRNIRYTALKDITQRINTEKDLIEAKDKAEESDRLKSAFLANMSHEIRTPMNGILGFAELLKEPHLEESEQKQFIEVIERSGNRMLAIINDLIDISKIEANQMEVILSKVDINAQLDDLYEFFTPESEVKKINLCYNAPKYSRKMVVQTDQQKLYAILTNLIKNSVKHTNGGVISFGYQKKQHFLEFYVIDSGTGIPLEKQKNIFERFVQAEQSHTRQYEGAGLGLAITKAYVEMLGGTIWIESSNENGTEIRFTILL